MTPLYASAAMRALMSDRARLQRMLDFEAALARAEAAFGVIGATAAVTIGHACDAGNRVARNPGGKAAPCGGVGALFAPRVFVAPENVIVKVCAFRKRGLPIFVHLLRNIEIGI